MGVYCLPGQVGGSAQPLPRRQGKGLPAAGEDAAGIWEMFSEED